MMLTYKPAGPLYGEIVSELLTLPAVPEAGHEVVVLRRVDAHHERQELEDGDQDQEPLQYTINLFCYKVLKRQNQQGRVVVWLYYRKTLSFLVVFQNVLDYICFNICIVIIHN